MKVYVILREREDEYEDYECFSFAEIYSKGFKSFERAEQYILENGCKPVDIENNVEWNEYKTESGRVFMSIKEVTIES